MECGFDEDAALKALKPLTVTNMNNIFDVGTCDALTGPVLSLIHILNDRIKLSTRALLFKKYVL